MTLDSPKLLYKYLQIINPDLKDRTHLLQSLLVRCPIRRLQRAYNILGSIDDGCLDSQSMAELLDSLLQRRLQALRLAAVVPADRLAMLVDHLARGLKAIGLLAVLFHLDDAQAQKLNLGLRVGQHLVGFRQQLLVASDAQRLDHVFRPGLHLHLDLQLLLQRGEHFVIGSGRCAALQSRVSAAQATNCTADQEAAIGINAGSDRF